MSQTTRIAIALAALSVAHCGNDTSHHSADHDANADTGSDVAVGDTVDDPSDSGADAGDDAAVDAPGDTRDAEFDGDINIPETRGDVDADAVRGTVRGTVEGTTLPTELTLYVDGGAVETLLADSSASFEFSETVAPDTAVEVRVSSHAVANLCTASAALETDANDFAVTVSCVPAYDVPSATFSRSDGVLYHTIRDYFGVESGFVVTGYESRDPGADALPFTADDGDVGGWTQRSSYDGRTNTITAFAHVGDDGEPFTDDDPIDFYTTYEAGAFDVVLLNARAVDPGPDGEWRTDDDLYTTGSERGGVVEGLREGAFDCRATWTAGDDQLLGTDDDALGAIRWRPTEYFAPFDAYPNRWETMDGPGDDGVPCTDDDDRAAGFDEPGAFVSADERRRYEITADGFTETAYVAEREVRRITSYRRAGDEIGGPEIDEVELYAEFVMTAFGETRRILATDPGEDGEWFTADDVFTSADDYLALNPLTGEAALSVTYAGEGPLQGADGIWGTRDDQASQWSIDTRSESLRCWVDHQDAGADGLWDVTDCGNGALDDTITRVAWNEVDDQGRIVRSCVSTGPGADGEWATLDDEMPDAGSGCSTHTWLDRGRAVMHILSGFGEDGMLFTEDDPVERTFLIEHDAFGGMTLYAELSGPGPDGDWFTEDDEVRGEYTTWTRDRFRQLGTRTVFGGAGADGAWFTGDDVVFQHAEYQRVDRRHYAREP